MLGVLDRFTRSITDAVRHVVLCGVHTELMGSLEDFGIIRLIGTENVFATDHGIFASAEAALQRAAEIVEEGPDNE